MGTKKKGRKKEEEGGGRPPQVRAAVLNATLHALLPFSLHVAPVRVLTKAVECIYFSCVRGVWRGGDCHSVSHHLHPLFLCLFSPIHPSVTG